MLRTSLTYAVAAITLGLTTSAANAQVAGDFDVWPDVLMSANSGGNGYMVNGIGSPSVTYDSNRDRYLMVFEVRLPATDPNCPAGLWGLGIAESPDGISWTPQSTPLLEPQPGSYYSCVAAHPSTMYDVKNKRLFVFFKAEQDSAACDAGPQAWGCNRYTGVGQIEVKYFNNGNVKTVRTEATPTLVVGQNFGYPKVIRTPAGNNTGYYMLLTRRPDAYLARGTANADRIDWTLTGTPVMQPGTVSWAMTELINPALVCEGTATYNYSSFIGGRTILGGLIDAGGWGKSVSDDSTNWLFGADPIFSFNGAAPFRHWDVLRVGSNPGADYLVWFSEKDGNNKNQIRFATTTATWNNADVYDRQCN